MILKTCIKIYELLKQLLKTHDCEEIMLKPFHIEELVNFISKNKEVFYKRAIDMNELLLCIKESFDRNRVRPLFACIFGTIEKQYLDMDNEKTLKTVEYLVDMCLNEILNHQDINTNTDNSLDELYKTYYWDILCKGIELGVYEKIQKDVDSLIEKIGIDSDKQDCMEAFSQEIVLNKIFSDESRTKLVVKLFSLVNSTLCSNSLLWVKILNKFISFSSVEHVIMEMNMSFIVNEIYECLVSDNKVISYSLTELLNSCISIHLERNIYRPNIHKEQNVDEILGIINRDIFGDRVVPIRVLWKIALHTSILKSFDMKTYGMILFRHILVDPNLYVNNTDLIVDILDILVGEDLDCALLKLMDLFVNGIVGESFIMVIASYVSKMTDISIASKLLSGLNKHKNTISLKNLELRMKLASFLVSSCLCNDITLGDIKITVNSILKGESDWEFKLTCLDNFFMHIIPNTSEEMIRQFLDDDSAKSISFLAHNQKVSYIQVCVIMMIKALVERCILVDGLDEELVVNLLKAHVDHEVKISALDFILSAKTTSARLLTIDSLKPLLTALSEDVRLKTYMLIRYILLNNIRLIYEEDSSTNVYKRLVQLYVSNMLTEDHPLFMDECCIFINLIETSKDMEEHYKNTLLQHFESLHSRERTIGCKYCEAYNVISIIDNLSSSHEPDTIYILDCY